MILVESEGKIILARLGVTISDGKSLGLESFTYMLVSSGLVMRGPGLTLLSTSANFRISLLSVPWFLPAACTEIRNLN